LNFGGLFSERHIAGNVPSIGSSRKFLAGGRFDRVKQEIGPAVMHGAAEKVSLDRSSGSLCRNGAGFGRRDGIGQSGARTAVNAIDF
jgi:hypothetical protein